MIDKFKELIENFDRILVTSHISPDPDAISSTLLLGRTLKENHPDKDIRMVLEEKPGAELSFLKDYESIEFRSLAEVTDEYKPQLFIIVDGNNLSRVSRQSAEEIRAKLHNLGCKLAIIDHHEEGDKDSSDVFINSKRPATAEEIYVVCFEQLKLRKPPSYAETALLGIVSDTQRHRFDHPGYRETYRIVSELLDAGASIEKLEVKLEHYSKGEMEVVAELANNIISSSSGYSYSFISDDFSNSFFGANKDPQAIKDACDEFVNRYIRAFENCNWGFVIYPEKINDRLQYSVTMRSVSGARDVSEIARSLGGGGHKPAAGAKIQAASVQEALELVKSKL